MAKPVAHLDGEVARTVTYGSVGTILQRCQGREMAVGMHQNMVAIVQRFWDDIGRCAFHSNVVVGG